MDRLAVRTKASHVAQMAVDRNGVVDEEKVIELIKALLASNVKASREIAREVGKIAERKISDQTAFITTAATMEKSVQQSLFEKLVKKFPQLKKVEWNTDPQLIGGFTIKIGDTWIDASIANDLSTIRERLSQ